MLLRFTVKNHRSIRDEAELSLVSAKWDGTAPHNGAGWSDIALPVIGIYGANASGKSTLIDAMRFLRDAVSYSATSWAGRETFPHVPFLLNKESAGRPSHYELDGVIDDIRYCYGFSSTGEGIRQEWLYAFPYGRKRVIFERDGSEFTFRRGLSEAQALSRLTKRTVLFLSMAGVADFKPLSRIQHRIADHFAVAQLSNVDRQIRLRLVTDALSDPVTAARVMTLLSEADLGIDSLLVKTQKVPSELEAVISEFVWSLQTKEVQESRDLDPEKIRPQGTRRTLTFRHIGADGPHDLPISSESAGTIAWLSLAVPAMRAIDQGDTLVIDEIDSSLHPRLTAALVSMFYAAWPHSKAQLIFTSHDTSLLGPLTNSHLDRDSVWFTEKRRDGSTELYALAEFSPRDAHNIERRYLQGRYGAIPVVVGDALLPGGEDRTKPENPIDARTR